VSFSHSSSPKKNSREKEKKWRRDPAIAIREVLFFLKKRRREPLMLKLAA
jgi:hypothetical protein